MLSCLVLMQSMTISDVMELASEHTLKEACGALGVGSTRFKKFLRENGLKPWPHRTIKSLREILRPGNPMPSAQKLRVEAFLKKFMRDPMTNIPDWIRATRIESYNRKKGTRNRGEKIVAAKRSSDVLVSAPPHVCDAAVEFDIRCANAR